MLSELSQASEGNSDADEFSVIDVGETEALFWHKEPTNLPQRRPLIMLTLLFYTEPNKVGIMPPRCVILDSIPAFQMQKRHDV